MSFFVLFFLEMHILYREMASHSTVIHPLIFIHPKIDHDYHGTKEPGDQNHRNTKLLGTQFLTNKVKGDKMSVSLRK